MPARLLLPLLLLGWACVGALANIKDIHIISDDRTLIPLTEGFVFADKELDWGQRQGKIDLTISRLLVHPGQNASKTSDLNKMGLFLSGYDEDSILEMLLPGDSSCVLDSEFVPSNDVLIRFSDSLIEDLLDKGKPASLKRERPVSGRAFLYFGSCQLNTPVSFDIHIEMYNEDSENVKDYLSVGDSELGTVYWVMFSFFTTMLVAWCVVVWRSRAFAQRIHYLMGVLAFFKALTLMSQAIQIHFIQTTGSPDGWNIAFYIFTFFRGILFFTIIVLIGTGWSYMKPFLGDREKRILMVVIPLQVFANIAIIITDEESPAERDWFTWLNILHLVDIICCCAILFPIVWSIKNLREASQTDGKAARNLEKLTLFRQFYIMVVLYIYFTRIVVYLLRSTVPYQYAWVSEAADEMAALAFYVWTAVSFRPHDSNPYLRLPVAENEIELK